MYRFIQISRVALQDKDLAWLSSKSLIYSQVGQGDIAVSPNTRSL